MPMEDKNKKVTYKDFADCVSQNQWADDPNAYCGKIKTKTEEAQEKNKTTYEKSVKMWQEKSSDFKPEIEDEDEYKKKQKELDEEQLTKKVEGEQKKALGVESTKLDGQESQLRSRIEKSSRDVIGR